MQSEIPSSAPAVESVRPPADLVAGKSSLVAVSAILRIGLVAESPRDAMESASPREGIVEENHSLNTDMDSATEAQLAMELMSWTTLRA